ncbi:Polyribonucleotide nucleotidyltransferase [Porphyridium purpureum]|uniref:polyribonucleotide nucleotidyltransferase n=1 Tax=Porphyridium purpureum TaxID=35688 RepID=A0A5J4Z0M0_PORPP|nr:Polyribonucleotide nucleotidyltransferase [Porphyridium purpureum]|eukprot:POR6461..scf209_3
MAGWLAFCWGAAGSTSSSPALSLSSPLVPVASAHHGLACACAPRRGNAPRVFAQRASTPHHRKRCAATRRLARVSADEDEPGISLDEEEDSEDGVVSDTVDASIRARQKMLESPNLALGIPELHPQSVEFELHGRKISLETGKFARQAGGAVMVRDGSTMVFSTACSAPAETVQDFLPLRVDYAEKLSSAGRTAGSYIKREGRPSEREILTSRLIDRPLRPMFLDGYYDEVQLLSTVFSFDGIHAADTWGICGAAAALHISSIPLQKAVAAVRVVHVDGTFVVNPTVDVMARADSDIIVAGTDSAVLMIEGACHFLTEQQILEAIVLAQESIAIICAAMDALRQKAGKEKVATRVLQIPDGLIEQMASRAAGLDEAFMVIGKKDREKAVEIIKKNIWEGLAPTAEDIAKDPEASAMRSVLLKVAWKKFASDCMRRIIETTGIRPDGRDCFSVRPIWIEQTPLPQTHGSSLFTRGETQTLAVATLGGEDASQRFESLLGDGASRFYLQYSFPPYSVGEVGRVGAPGRREIGHGKLAERGLAPCLPSRAEFPYVIRLESNITESNGSSSMASVCGGCLAMMDAGVPLKEHVAGIAMGLILNAEDKRVTVLTDILGLEDALGDMDFKVAGTADAITSLQMDIKVEGITVEIMSEALSQAKKGRLHILEQMKAACPSHRAQLPPTVPRIRTLAIPPSKIGELIGPGGKKIRALVEECGGEEKLSINIEQDGMVSFSSFDDVILEMAIKRVQGATMEINPGTRFTGKVSKLMPFGAYVSLVPGKEGWLHISEVEIGRTSKIEDVLKEGDEIDVVVIERGRNDNQFRVSRRNVLIVDQGLTREQVAEIVRASSPPDSDSEVTPGSNSDGNSRSPAAGSASGAPRTRELRRSNGGGPRSRDGPGASRRTTGSTGNTGERPSGGSSP